VEKTSKLNLILVLITILSIGIALGVLIKYRKSENTDITKEITVTSENEPVDESESYDAPPMGEVEPLPESEMASLSNPFDKSLDSPETGEFVKSILRESFAYQVNQSSFGKISKPFNDKIRNFPVGVNDEINEKTIEEVLKLRKDSVWFNYEQIESIINNFQLVNCQKGVAYNSKIMYTCSFILSTLEGTGVDTESNRLPNNFLVKLIQQEVGYTVESFK
jgi:hypothetical protein